MDDIRSVSGADVPSAKKPKKKKKKRRVSFSTILLIVVLTAGAALLIYPSASDWWNSSHAYKDINNYVAKVEDMSGSDKDAYFKEAEDYNKKLTGGPDFSLDPDEYAEYLSMLDIAGTGIMGYVQIPSINVNLPIYHTVEEKILQSAVGHIPGTSLPVGGTGTHAVLSGHRGLPSMKLFSDLDKVSEGDVFMVNVLDRTFTYQVDQIRIVLPGVVDDLRIDPGEDYCTLVTCTPYGVNSHRMLVRGTRIENLKEEAVVRSDAKKIPGYAVIPFAAAPILALALVVMAVVGRTSGRKRKSRSRLLAELSREGIDLGSGKSKKEGKNHEA